MRRPSDALACAHPVFAFVDRVAAAAVEAKRMSPEEAAGLTIGLVIFGFFGAVVYFAINTRTLREEAKEKRLLSEKIKQGLVVAQN